MVKNALCLIAFIFFISSAFAEDITITTYYPSPYGSYNELQLFPHVPQAADCNAAREGTLAYDSSGSGTLKVCKNAAGWVWQPVGGGGDQFTMACLGGMAGLMLPSCCRMDSNNGQTTCWRAADWGGVNWVITASPFPAPGPAGRYSISLIWGQNGSMYPACCKLNALTGHADCKTATDWSLPAWNNWGGAGLW